MRIQHNIMAMNAYRNYNINTSSLSKNLEKLSSGYKINRAGDDAAGLAISEKMRAQITGLNAAQKNVKDGISLVKTAEGAMQEVQDMLNRMDYLATQSANGTYDNEVDRANLQKEVEALKTEINRIADSANFNGIKLLDGSQSGVTAQGAYTETLTAKTINGIDRILSSDITSGQQPWQVNGKANVYDKYAPAATKAEFNVDLSKLKGGFTFNASATMGAATVTGSALGADLVLSIGGQKITIKASALGSAIKVTIASTGKVTCSINATALASAALKSIGSTASKQAMTINGVKWKVTASGGKLNFKQFVNPTSASQCQANFAVKVTYGTDGVASASKGSFKLNGDVLDGTEVVKPGSPEGASMGAATVFNVQKSDIVDGAVINIGGNKYTLAVGAKSQQKTTDANVIDLTSLDANNIDLNDALSRISAGIGSTVSVTGKNHKGETVTATFKIGVSNNASAAAVGIAVMRASAPASIGQIAWDTRSKLAELFSITHQGGTIDHEAREASGGLMLQIGDTSDNFNQMRVIIGDMHTSAMGIADVNISNQQSAQDAVQTIKDAINYVSGIRGDLGAVQNRLEHTQNNLSVMAENIQDAESTIRDTDVAEEMMSYVKNNILVQSAQAMLAQANQVPQGVLQLLG